MNRLPQMTLLTTVMVLGLGLLASEGWVLRKSYLAAARAWIAVEQKKQERDWLARQSPALSAENEAALATDLASGFQLLAELRPALQGNEPSLFESPPPTKSIDAFFELASFIDKLRTRAAQAQVVLKPDECFGFATHANEGPLVEHIAVVHRQRLVTQYLVEALLESRPLALLAVRRERPRADGPSDQRDRAEDFFELDRPLSLRQPGQMESESFRLEFTGQTTALRNFLNNLAALRQPVVVRSVEVEPVATDLAATSAAVGSPVPLVGQSLSKFTVTGEFALLADSAVTATP